MPLTLRALATGLSLISAASPVDVWANGLEQSASCLLQMDKAMPMKVMSDSPAPHSEPSSATMLSTWGDESLRDWSVKSLVIVGNGPLYHHDRERIKKFPEERVIRFNSMVNLRLDEPVGHLYANACASGWWGVTSLTCSRIRIQDTRGYRAVRKTFSEFAPGTYRSF
eukprot:1788794-Amphidinium_carterae.1